MIRALRALTVLSMTLVIAPIASAADGWQCQSGITTPVRVNNGHVECASNDGTNCLWDTCPTLPSGNLQPLACGAAHQAKHGVDGYSKADHWCAQVCNKNKACTAGYQCLAGITSPVRISGGDIQCASKNGRDCLWDSCKKVGGWHPSGSVSHLKPLSCGADHTKKHGSDGYSVADHWCRKACDTLSCGK